MRHTTCMIFFRLYSFLYERWFNYILWYLLPWTNKSTSLLWVSVSMIFWCLFHTLWGHRVLSIKIMSPGTRQIWSSNVCLEPSFEDSDLLSENGAISPYFKGLLQKLNDISVNRELSKHPVYNDIIQCLVDSVLHVWLSYTFMYWFHFIYSIFTVFKIFYGQ